MDTQIVLLLLLGGFGVGFVVGLRRRRPFMSADEKASLNPAAQSAATLAAKERRTSRLETGILEKKMLYDEELTLLLRLDRELAGTIKVNEIGRIIVDHIQKVMNTERCALLLMYRQTETLRIAYSKGISADDAEKTVLKKGESISGWVASSNETLYIKNIENDYWVKTINKEPYYTGSLVSIPLSLRNNMLGVLNVNNKKLGEQFTNDDMRLLKAIASQSATALQNARLYEELEEGYLRTVMALAAALDAKDPYTRRHSENVTRYATAIAQELKLSEAEVEFVKRAGLLHDIGKIAIHDNVLTSQHALTPEEYEIVKTHSAKGEEIISSLPFLKDVALCVRHHHEWFDGKGYPDGKKGYQIELSARILTVSDAFDAMVSDRSYRKALSVEQACAELKKHSGTQFDPEIADAFLRIIEKNPSINKS